MAATAKVITLKGDPKNPESAENIIIFPGGSISVCRTSNGEYWAHIEVNHGQVIEGTVRVSKKGIITESRIDRTAGKIAEIPDVETVNHIAIRIKTK